MSLTLQELANASAALPAAERAQLAQILLESLETEETGWSAAWEVELSRRLDEFRLGKVVGIPAEEVLKELRELYP